MLFEKFEYFYNTKLIPDEFFPQSSKIFINNIYNLLKNKLNGITPDKQLKQISEFVNKIERHLLTYKKDGYPMSLTLYQLIFGILIKENIINDSIIEKQPLIIDEIFENYFPEIKKKKYIPFQLS